MLAEMTGKSRPGSGPNDLSWRAGAVLVAVMVVVFCVNLNDARSLSGHERYPASGAKQMVESGDWLVPHVGDAVWLEKPPLLHWLAGLSLIAFDRNEEWVVRLPSVLAGAGLVLLVALLASWWLGPTAGLLAGFVQCTSYYTFTYARLAEADMLLAFNVVAALTVFVYLVYGA